MSLIVETGEITPNANSYVLLSELKSYVGSVTLPTATDSELERALVNACRYLDGHYRKRWKGRKVEPVTQPLEWPRGGVDVVDPSSVNSATYDVGFGGAIFIPSDVIPQRLKDSQCEAALLLLSGVSLSPSLNVSIQSEKLDVIETTYKSGAKAGQVEFPVIDQLLSDYLQPIGIGAVIRA